MDATGQVLLSAALALLPQIQAAADEIERERQLPRPLVEALMSAGLFRMTVARELGGGECDPETIVRIIEAVAAVDASTGWCIEVSCQNGIESGILPLDVARSIYGAVEDNVTLVIHRNGRAQSVAGGYQVTGRWSFASGCRHATWLSGAGTIYDGDSPRVGPDGQPQLYVFFFPVAACEIIDTWHVIGLQGTGSHDFAVAEIFVPEERAMLWDFTTPRNPGRLYAFGVGIIAPTFAAIALGIARGALDALADLSARKTPRAGGGLLLRDQPVAQHRVGVAEAQLRGARALLLETIRDAWEETAKNGSLTADQRSLLVWASAHATAMAKQAVDVAWELAGGSAVFDGSLFERRFRDMHMVTQHFSVASSHYADGGRIFLTTPPAG